MSVIVKGGGGKSSGLYAWKKYRPDFSITLTLIHANPLRFNISFSDGRTITSLDDIKNIKFSFLESTEYYCIINNNNELEYYRVGSTPYATYECYISDGYLIIMATPVDIEEALQGLIYNGEKIFIDYIVSDKETTYPDGAEKDGYYYESVSGGGSKSPYAWRITSEDGT